jgi:hypothetical protein
MSTSGGVFYTYTSGNGTASNCYFGYPGRSVWVTVGGVKSNAIAW